MMHYAARLTELEIDIHKQAWNLANLARTNLGYVPALVLEIVDYTGRVIIKSNPDQPHVPAGYSTGGQFTRDGTNGGQPTGWGGDDKSLQRHYKEHAKDFDAKSPQEYIRADRDQMPSFDRVNLLYKQKLRAFSLSNLNGKRSRNPR